MIKRNFRVIKNNERGTERSLRRGTWAEKINIDLIISIYIISDYGITGYSQAYCIIVMPD